MCRLGLFLLLSVSGPFGYAQTFKLIQQVSIDKPASVSTDTNGNIYFATFKGDIVRYDRELSEMEVFSPPNPANADLLEAWQGLRIFTFHRELQQYRLINRNLSLHEDYHFPTDKAGFVQIATTTFDNNLWLIDQVDFSLKKLQLFTNAISVLSPLNLLLNPDNHEITWIREYQNRLFIGVKQIGILIFDNMGNYIKTYDEPLIGQAGFYGDTLYYIKEQHLYQVNIYTDEKNALPLPTTKPWNYCIKSSAGLYLFSERSLDFYQLSSE